MRSLAADAAIGETQIDNFIASVPERLSARSRQAFYAALVKEHLDRIFNYCRYLTGSKQEAEDLSQETFLSLWENLQQLDTATSVRPWLYRVARNKCYDHLRRKSAIPFAEAEEAAMNVPDEAPHLESQLDSQLFLDRVKGCVLQLPLREREILTLKYFEDQTFEQIAELTGDPVNTIKSSFYRGKSKLFEMLNR